MKTRIVSGLVFVSDLTAKTSFSQVEKLTSAPGWSCVSDRSGGELGRDAQTAGWAFFYLAGEIRSTCPGPDDELRAQRSLQRLLESAALGPCNCLQLTDVKHRSLFGMPYTSLVAHAKCIHKGRRVAARRNPDSVV